MAKIIRLTESDLARLVEKVLRETIVKPWYDTNGNLHAESEPVTAGGIMADKIFKNGMPSGGYPKKIKMNQGMPALQEQLRRQSTAKRFITEAMAEAQSLLDKAEEMVDSGQKPDPVTASKILGCIKQEGFTHLSVTSIGAGSYALGVIAAIISAASFVPAMLLAISGAIIMFLESIGIGGSGVENEVKRLISCVQSKK